MIPALVDAVGIALFVSMLLMWAAIIGGLA